MNDAELNERLARAAGLEFPGAWECSKCPYILQRNFLSAADGEVWADARIERLVCPNEGADMRPYYPPFAASIDAQAPLEAKAREQGWRLDIGEADDGVFEVSWLHSDGGYRFASAPTEARARAEVLLAVLEVSDGA